MRTGLAITLSIFTFADFRLYVGAHAKNQTNDILEQAIAAKKVTKIQTIIDRRHKSTEKYMSTGMYRHAEAQTQTKISRGRVTLEQVLTIKKQRMENRDT